MVATAPLRRSNRYPEAVLLGLVAHDVLAGGVFWLVGMSGIGAALWAIGTGLTAGYLIVWLGLECQRPRDGRRIAVSVAALAIVAATAALGWLLVSSVFGVVLLTVLLRTEPDVSRAAVPGSQHPAE